jgi:hypothetical protein
MSGTSCLLKVNLTFPTFQDAHQLISPYQHSSDPREEFSKLLHDTGFEVIDCQFRDSEHIYDSLGSLRGDCWIYINLTLKIIFMEAIPLCLLLNKTHFFSLTQHTFIQSIQFPSPICYMFRLIFRHVNTRTYTGRYNNILGTLLIFTIFIVKMAKVQPFNCPYM